MQCLDTLQDIIRPIIDRQRQKDVLYLPPACKIEVSLPMTDDQHEKYEAYMALQRAIGRAASV